MYIQRNLEGTIRKYLDAPEILAIVGPRQSGKTTMLQHLMKGFPRAVSVSFDDQNILAMFEQATDDFITAYVRGNSYLFLDEFQYAKHGGKILKYIHDAHKKTKIIISGSSAVDLTVKAARFLVGRILVFHLPPFNFSEFLTARDPAYAKIHRLYALRMQASRKGAIIVPHPVHVKFVRLYEEYLLFGGYPRVVLEPDHIKKQELLRNIYNTYFLREVRDILGLVEDYKLQLLMKALALQIGGLISYGELGNLSGFSYVSVKKYVNFLEKTYICIFARPFYRNKRTEIVKNPKVYFFDTGMRNSIVNDFRALRDRPDRGAILENGLAMQFVKSGVAFNFWRDKKQHEVDFVCAETSGIQRAIESKTNLRDSNIAGIRAFSAAYPTIRVCTSYLLRSAKQRPYLGAFPAYLF